MEDRPISARARKKVEAQIEKAAKERLTKLFQRRMELARNGAIAFRHGKFKDSIHSYYSYIDILERTKEVPKDGLQPKHFDSKKDIAELLLLSGVFWDLAKMHDRGGKKTHEKLKYYLDRFVMFSRGMPFQHVSSELVRKFLVNGNLRNRKEFKEAHIRLGGGKCFVATAVEERLTPDIMRDLRAYRDQFLMKRLWGRGLVRAYYAVGPTLAIWVIRSPEAMQNRIARLVKQFANSLRMKIEL